MGFEAIYNIIQQKLNDKSNGDTKIRLTEGVKHWPEDEGRHYPKIKYNN